MEEMTIEELTKLFIKEDFEERKEKKYYKITKKEMINLCLKVVKLMESVKNGWFSNVRFGFYIRYNHDGNI